MVANMAHWKLGKSQMDIMLDGYIAQTLTPFCTEKYLKIFMSCLGKQRGSLFVFNNQWIVARPTTQQQKQRRATTRPKPGNCSNARAKTRASLPPEVFPTAARVPMSPLVNNDYAADTVYEIFDRKVDLEMGTIVPQPSVIGVSKKTGVLSPVFFIQRDGTLGIPYEFPLPERCILHNATALAPTILKREKQNVRIRVQWPGYKRLQYEFRIQDRRLDKQVPITMARLVERIMRGIHRLFLEGKRDPDTFQFNERWKLGNDGIQASELTIIGLIHMSRGLWVPILQLARHIMPRWDWEYYNQPVTEKKQSKEDWDMQSKDDKQSEEGSD
ncbi:hypothetical protein F5888DRAFT_366206 [Russula emetica]|nr:hypothetical protein F5888DRAFT_366206 [Russula emetica]